MNRDTMKARIVDPSEDPLDFLVVGGGATGVGIAVDAASRGYRVLLVEQSDFGKGTSSRSTKLVHGGVRYLQQGNVPLVMEALRERGLLLRNAPHLVRDQAFVVPNYDWWEAPFYGVGMKVYDLLARRFGFGRSRLLSVEEVRTRIPTLATEGLRGGVVYHDGQFDDARLLIHLVRTAVRHGATVLNHCPLVALLRNGDGYVDGGVIRDLESGEEHEVRARVVINATGAFADGILRMSDPEAPTLIAPSQGVHIVLHRRFLPGDAAIMVPRTSDGRVLFAIPWHDHALVGTTDTALEAVELEPRAREEEIAFLLETAGEYLADPPRREDILSVFTGIRPLVKAGDGEGGTAALSRDHTIHIDGSGLLTIVGGKWTTYRKMAQDAVDHAATLAGMEERPCVTRGLEIHGYHPESDQFGALAVHGSDAPAIRDLVREEPALGEPLHPDLPTVGAEVVWAVRHEMARTVEDVLARRCRAVQLNARAARAMGPDVARIMARELGRDEEWEEAQLSALAEVLDLHLPVSAP
ncbi:MAG: glycerol-3-phosphate dehydrogenase/oxidase [Gemmatimonadales bacterium]|nr:MAG: glycerol-3-phosphate dehydrogenase/oxidase [Gemmatimonadales bacterium]